MISVMPNVSCPWTATPMVTSVQPMAIQPLPFVQGVLVPMTAVSLVAVNVSSNASVCETISSRPSLESLDDIGSSFSRSTSESTESELGHLVFGLGWIQIGFRLELGIQQLLDWSQSVSICFNLFIAS